MQQILSRAAAAFFQVSKYNLLPLSVQLYIDENALMPHQVKNKVQFFLNRAFLQVIPQMRSQKNQLTVYTSKEQVMNLPDDHKVHNGNRQDALL